jgi:hypothetical protein
MGDDPTLRRRFVAGNDFALFFSLAAKHFVSGKF